MKDVSVEFPRDKAHPLSDGWSVWSTSKDCSGILKFVVCEDGDLLRLENHGCANAISLSLEDDATGAPFQLDALRQHRVTLRYRTVGEPGAFMALHPTHVIGVVSPEPGKRDDSLRFYLTSKQWTTLRVEFATGAAGPLRLVMSTTQKGEEHALEIAECLIEEVGPYLSPRIYAKTTPPFEPTPLAWLDGGKHGTYRLAATDPQNQMQPGGLPFGWVFTRHVEQATGRIEGTNVLGVGCLALKTEHPRASPSFVARWLPNYIPLSARPGCTYIFSGIYATTGAGSARARLEFDMFKRGPAGYADLGSSRGRWSGFWAQARVPEPVSAEAGLQGAGTDEADAVFIRSLQLVAIPHVSR